VCPDISVVQIKQMCSLYESEDEDQTVLSKVTRTLMRDSSFKATDNLLVDVDCIKVITSDMHYVHLNDLETISFSKSLANIVRKYLKKKL